MKIHSLIFGVVATGCAMAVVLPRSAEAITDEEFRALQQQLQQQQQQIQQLQDQRKQDQQEIQELKRKVDDTEQKVNETQKSTAETQKTAEEAHKAATEAVAQVQPVHPVPSGALSATHNFAMVGDAEVQFVRTEGQHSAFVLADFAPIFLYRAGDNVLFEAGFDINLQNNAPNGSDATTSINLSFAQLDYLYNDYLTVVAGDMVLPLGTYSERAAGWLNKIPDDPLPRSILPGSGVGLQLRGSLPVGQSGQMVTYSVYGVNGPGSVDGTGTSTNLDLGGNVGIRSDGVVANLHGNPSAGGRVGWFIPWKAHYDLELGVSGQAGEWDNAGKRLWSTAVFDASLHLSPYFETKGEYINTWVETDNLGNIRPWGWWIQTGYKLAGLDLDFPMVNNVELVARYDTVRDGMGTRTERYSLGYVYYITNTLQFEGDYEFLNSSDPTQKNTLILQLSYGF